jgi:hypothetical protein
MAKWGIGSAIVSDHDRRGYLSSVWIHPYRKHIPFSRRVGWGDRSTPAQRAKDGRAKIRGREEES